MNRKPQRKYQIFFINIYQIYKDSVINISKKSPESVKILQILPNETRTPEITHLVTKQSFVHFPRKQNCNVFFQNII